MTKKCTKCWRTGHRSSACPYLRNASATSSSTVDTPSTSNSERHNSTCRKCSFCGNTGHMFRRCPTRLAGLYDKSSSSSDDDIPLSQFAALTHGMFNAESSSSSCEDIPLSQFIGSTPREQHHLTVEVEMHEEIREPMIVEEGGFAWGQDVQHQHEQHIEHANSPEVDQIGESMVIDVEGFAVRQHVEIVDQRNDVANLPEVARVVDVEKQAENDDEEMHKVLANWSRPEGVLVASASTAGIAVVSVMGGGVRSPSTATAGVLRPNVVGRFAFSGNVCRKRIWSDGATTSGINAHFMTNQTPDNICVIAGHVTHL